MAAEKSEARAAARAALGEQERSKLDEELFSQSGLAKHEGKSANPGKIKELLDRGADPDGFKDEYGVTALVAAAAGGNATIIPLLLEAGANIEASLEIGDNTGLILATLVGYEAVVGELLKGNPNLERKNLEGKTALDYAREGNHQSIVDLLVNHV